MFFVVFVALSDKSNAFTMFTGVPATCELFYGCKVSWHDENLFVSTRLAHYLWLYCLSDSRFIHTLMLLFPPLSSFSLFDDSNKWTAEEDQLLVDAVSRYGEGNWAPIAAFVGKRTPGMVSNRWMRTLKPKSLNLPWSEEEDKVHLSFLSFARSFSSHSFIATFCVCDSYHSSAEKKILWWIFLSIFFSFSSYVWSLFFHSLCLFVCIYLSSPFFLFPSHSFVWISLSVFTFYVWNSSIAAVSCCFCICLCDMDKYGSAFAPAHASPMSRTVDERSWSFCWS